MIYVVQEAVIEISYRYLSQATKESTTDLGYLGLSVMYLIVCMVIVVIDINFIEFV